MDRKQFALWGTVSPVLCSAHIYDIHDLLQCMFFFFPEEEVLIVFYILKSDKCVYRQEVEHMVSQWSFNDLERNPLKGAGTIVSAS